MIETRNKPNLLQEYVLDLLPATDKEQLAQQIRKEPELQAKVQQEQRVGQLVKQTLQKATAVDNGRLVQLMPPIPRRKRFTWPAVKPRMLGTQLAAVALLLMLLFGSWQWFNNDPAFLWPTSPTIVAVTATTTFTPTATETQTMPTETAVANQPKSEPDVITTPAPLPTPVAAVSINTN